ncbi:DUF2141 domain-containing protein [Hyphococcus sp.]|uniref:DUF2141 domain-containing protein n=1 Tax=Hyphococcus sp. TaxID=2038636 RepID=UPI00208758C0|nr:MAG: hypothetical protein DHS20C04_03410 [Marinicaulis sp.]
MRVRIVAVLFAGAAIVSNSALADDDNLAAEAYNFEHVSCTGAKNEIRIVISGVKKSVGLMTVDLFPNDDEKFLHGSGRIMQVRFAAKSPVTKFCVDAPESGFFAMSAYHDENANQKFDKNAFGLPAEPWGLSNNPKVRLAPPPVEKALFDVTAEGGAHVHIKLN